MVEFRGILGVTLVLAHVGSAQVERQLVLDELRGIAEGKVVPVVDVVGRSEEHTSELQSH